MRLASLHPLQNVQFNNIGDKMADFIYPSNFILKGLYQNLCSNLEKNITK